MLSDAERDVAEVPLKALKQKAKRQGADPFQTFKFTSDEEVLSDEVRLLLCLFLDYMWSLSETKIVDMRIVLPDELFRFLAMLGTIGNPQEADLLEKLHSLFEEIPREIPRTYPSTGPKLALRMTQGPSNACINFHCDGTYATGTVQIALNSPEDYTGGQLCFFVNDHLEMLERPAGSVCQHPCRVLHGVSALMEGTRKSLFVVDWLNGLGERGVVDATHHHVQGFIKWKQDTEEKRPRVPTCCACLVKNSDHALLPCGHLCLCFECSGEIQTCPLCKGHVESKQKIFF